MVEDSIAKINSDYESENSTRSIDLGAELAS